MNAETRAAIEACAARVAAEAPPFTAEQLDFIATAFRGAARRSADSRGAVSAHAGGAD